VAPGESKAEVEHLARAAGDAGVSCELLDVSRTSQEEPELASGVETSLLIPTHGFVVAQELSLALRIAGERRGAEYRAGTRVQRVSRRSGAIELHVGNGDTVTAGRVVLAAGSWSGQIEIDGVPRLPVRPVRGQLLHLECDTPLLSRIVWGARCYLVPIGPSSILVGATVEEAGFDERVTAAGVRDLLDAACDLVPRLSQATFAGVRVGLRPATPDELPIVGPSACLPGLVYATGHYRNGILLAPLTARAVADLVFDRGEEPLLRAAAPQRFGEY
jgi:glycine oxidase